MSVQFPRDSPLQLNQGIPTGGRRRPLAGEDLVKVVVSVGFTGGPQPVAFHAYAPWEDAAHSSWSLAPAVGFLVVETFRPSAPPGSLWLGQQGTHPFGPSVSVGVC